MHYTTTSLNRVSSPRVGGRAMLGGAATLALALGGVALPVVATSANADNGNCVGTNVAVWSSGGSGLKDLYDIASSGIVFCLTGDITAPAAGSLDTPDNSAVTIDLNGHTLTITNPDNGMAAINVDSGESLTIDDSSTAQTGELNATGGSGGSFTGAGLGAGIGGDGGDASAGTGGTGGAVTVNGGVVNATGGKGDGPYGRGSGAGIGGGGGYDNSAGGAGGTVTVNGGVVNAASRNSDNSEGAGAGIGGGGGRYGGAGGTVTVSGGVINATGGDGPGDAGAGAGIGGGGFSTAGAGGTMTVNGGAVNATGGDSPAGSGAGAGAGIGGGSSGSGYPGGAGGSLSIAGLAPRPAQTPGSLSNTEDGKSPTSVGSSSVSQLLTWGFSENSGDKLSIEFGSPIQIAPANLAPTPGNTEVALTWDAVTATPAVTGYFVEYKKASDTAWTAFDTATNLTTLNRTVTGLDAGTEYDFRVAAINNAFGAGTPSMVTATPGAPAAPTTLAAAAKNASVDLSWTASSSTGVQAATGYLIQYRESSSTDWTGAPTQTVTGGATTAATVPATGALVNGTEYEFRIQATNSNGASSWSNTAKATPVTVPEAPAAPTVKAGNGEATVSWVAPKSGGSAISGYTIAYGPVGETPKLKTVGATPLEATITGLVNGTEYEFKVVATNQVGNSDPSPVSKVTPVTVPEAPAAPTVKVGNGEATVSWVAPKSGGSAISGYTIAYGPAGETPKLKSVGATPLEATITGLVNGTEYEFKVVATNKVGNSDPSPVSKVTPVTVPEAPAAPTVKAGNGEATVSWVAPKSGGSAISGYTIAYGPVGETPKLKTVGATPLEATITGLVNGTEYEFKVVATNQVGNSDPSPVSKVTPVTVPEAPAAPTVKAGNGEATVSWVAPKSGGSAISGYTIAYGPVGETPKLKTVGATPLEATITGLVNGTEYEFRVVATNKVGNSDPSPVSKATPVEEPTVDPTPGTSTDAQGRTVLTVDVTGGDPAPTVQWQQWNPATKSWEDIPGATGTSYTPTETGKYRAAVTNDAGTVTTDPQDVTVDTTPDAKPVATLSAGVAAAGDQLTVQASGLDANEELSIWVHSEPTLLWSGTASSTGALDQTVTLPTDLAPGKHRIEIKRAGGAESLWLDLTIKASLGKTGTQDTLPWVGGLAALLLLAAAGTRAIRTRARAR